MSSITLEFTYSEKCPNFASSIERNVFSVSCTAECESFTTEDHRTHVFNMNYDSDAVSKSAYSRLRNLASSMFSRSEDIVSYTIHRSPEKATILEY